MASTSVVKRVAAMLAVASLLAIGMTSVAMAAPISGGAETKASCLLPQEVLKNEPGLCSRVQGGEAQPVTRTTPSSSNLEFAWIVTAIAAAILLAGTARFSWRRRPRPVV